MIKLDSKSAYIKEAGVIKLFHKQGHNLNNSPSATLHSGIAILQSITSAETHQIVPDVTTQMHYQIYGILVPASQDLPHLLVLNLLH